MDGAPSPAPGTEPDLVLLTTDAATGKVTGAIALGTEWEQLLCEIVLDAGRQAGGPGA